MVIKEGKKRKAVQHEGANDASLSLNQVVDREETSRSDSQPYPNNSSKNSPKDGERHHKKKKKKKRKVEHTAVAEHDSTGQNTAVDTPAAAESGKRPGDDSAITKKSSASPAKRSEQASDLDGATPEKTLDLHGAARNNGEKNGNSHTDNSTEKSRPDSSTQNRAPQQSGDTSASSPPQEHRRLGKTHGRARKKAPGGAAGPSGFGGSSTGDGFVGRGAGKAGTGLTPGGPGQGKPRKHTLSIAIPGSVVDNAQNRELKSYLVGEIARAAAIFEVDEVVVYDDLSVSRKGQGGVRDDSNTGGGAGLGRGGGVVNASGGVGWASGGGGGGDRNNPNVFMARLLQYAETPQYLRKQLFPMHPTLRLAGLLNPLDAPHHMRADDECPFREGVVVDRAVKKGAGSFVDIGKRKEARIDRPLAAGVRVTVKLDQNAANRKNYCGRAVAPSAPREELGLYWGYQTRLANGMADVLSGCPYKGGYDLTLGTSERGSTTVDSPTFTLPEYRHVLIVFGGVQGIEATVDADETLQLPGSEASALFDMWVNTCPGQGSRTIRTEEAVLLTLARLRSHVLGNGTKPHKSSTSDTSSSIGGSANSNGGQS